jgi:hypothetical protein
MKRKREESGFGAFVRRYQVLILVVVLAVLIVPGAIFVIKDLRKGQSEEREIAPFTSHIDEYLTPPKQSTVVNQKGRGGVVPIDTKEKRVDRLYFELPKNLRAASPDAVATVVWLEWREEQVGQYAEGVPSCIERCDVTVIDKAQGVVIGKKQFKGGDPSATIKKNLSKGVGPRPYKEIVDYVASLCGT